MATRARSTLSCADGVSTGRFPLALLLTLGVACAACVVSPVQALAGTLDQQQTNGGGGSIGITSGSAAQTFTAGITGNLDQVDLDLENSGNPTPLVVEIRDLAGVPGNRVLASDNLPGTAVPSLPAFVPVAFNPPAAVAAGTQYAIVAYTSGGSNYRWEHSSAVNSYAGGAGFTTLSSPPSESVSWTSQVYDFTFKTYVVPTPPANTGQRAAALRKCKKKPSARARKRCRRKAKLLPV